MFATVKNASMSSAQFGQISLSFPPLTPETYPTWQVRMKALLQRERLFHTIEDDPPQEDDDEWPAWHEADQRARGTIVLGVCDTLLVSLEDAETARAVWDKLRNLHLRQGAGSSILFFKKLCRLELQKDGDLPSHLSQLQRLRQDLIQRDLTFSDAVFSMLMINSLDESYDAIASQLSALPNDRLTPDHVSSVLLNEFDRRQTVKESRGKAVENVSKPSAGESETTAKALKSVRCYGCGELGHYRSNCKKASKKKGNFKGGGGRRRPQGPAAQKALISRCTDKDAYSVFVVDSGATRHVSNDKSIFINLQRQEGRIQQADGSEIKSPGQGTISLQNLNATVKNVMYAPHLQDNLLSVSQLTSQGLKLVFTKSRCDIIRDNKLILYAKCVNGLYVLPFVTGATAGTAKKTKQAHCNISIDKNEKLHNHCIHDYHRLFGHLHFQALTKMQDLVDGMKVKKCPYHMKCISCAENKIKQASKGAESGREVTKPYEVIHADLVGPLAPSRGNSRYFLVLIDSFSRYVWVYVLQKKSEAFQRFQQFCAWLKNVHNEHVRCFFTDRGGEFCSEEFESFLSEQGIEHLTATPRSPWQNGLCERMNQTLQQGIRTLLHDSGLSNLFWGEALSCFTYVYNRRFHSSIKSTPYEMLFQKKPFVKHLKIFGSEVWVHTVKNDKLSKCGQHGIFLGYEKGSYRVLMTDTKAIRLTRSIDCNPKWDTVGIFQCYPLSDDGNVKPKPEKKKVESDDADSSDGGESDPDTDLHSAQASVKDEPEAGADEQPLFTIDPHSPKEEVDPDDQETVRRSERTTKGKPPKRFSIEFAKTAVTASNSDSVFEPTSYKEVQNMSAKDAEPWLNAMKSELNSLKQNETWELVPQEPGMKLVDSRWIFKAKTDKHGKVVRHKARLVARGFSQIPDQDYHETYSPTVRFESVRLLMKLAAEEGMTISHHDVNTAFLYGVLDENIYMQPPDGVQVKQGMVCKLKKSLYGLKQSSRCWYTKLTEILFSLGFEQGKADSCVFVKEHKQQKLYCIFYVDDLLFFWKNVNIYKDTLTKLQKHFDMKDLGDVTNYLSLEVERNDKGDVLLHQTCKINDLVQKLRLTESNAVDTPMVTGYQQDTTATMFPDVTLFRSILGKLSFIARCTRPDIAISVNLLSRYSNNPTVQDFKALKRIVNYLKGTMHYRLRLSSQKSGGLEIYTDASFGSDAVDGKSTSGICYMYNQCVFDWACKKQATVSLSSCEAELNALTHSLMDIEWLLQLCQDIRLKVTCPVNVYQDSKSCIALIHSEGCKQRTKHLQIKLQRARECIQKNVVKVSYVPGKEIPADVLTKAVNKEQLGIYVKQLQLC